MFYKFLTTLTIVFFCSLSADAQVLLTEDQQLLEQFQWLYNTNVKHACKQPNKSEIVETRVDQCNFMHDFKIYPNPATSEVSLEFKAESIPIKIFFANLEGKVLLIDDGVDFNGTYNRQFNISNFEKGIYIISILQKDEVFVRKLVVE